MNRDGEVASAAVSCCISRCVLDQSLSDWEQRAGRVAAGHCEATAYERHVTNVMTYRTVNTRHTDATLIHTQYMIETHGGNVYFNRKCDGLKVSEEFKESN